MEATPKNNDLVIVTCLRSCEHYNGCSGRFKKSLGIIVRNGLVTRITRNGKALNPYSVTDVAIFERVSYNNMPFKSRFEYNNDTYKTNTCEINRMYLIRLEPKLSKSNRINIFESIYNIE